MTSKALLRQLSGTSDEISGSANANTANSLPGKSAKVSGRWNGWPAASVRAASQKQLADFSFREQGGERIELHEVGADAARWRTGHGGDGRRDPIICVGGGIHPRVSGIANDEEAHAGCSAQREDLAHGKVERENRSRSEPEIVRRGFCDGKSLQVRQTRLPHDEARERRVGLKLVGDVIRAGLRRNGPPGRLLETLPEFARSKAKWRSVGCNRSQRK